MESVRAFEMKVGIFILIGIAILFLIVFSIGDITVSKAGYMIKVRFEFASGIGPSAPVRLAGVGVGQVKGIKVLYDEKDKKTKAELMAWINDGARIENDAKITINTLGLLGEKYLEIIPGTPGAPLLKAGDTVTGKDPIPMEKITENLAKMSDSVTEIVEKLKRGEGTIGKLLTDEKLYNDLIAFSDKMGKGEGTLPKLLTDDKVYKNLEAFTEDIKKHPWKLLNKPKGE